MLQTAVHYNVQRVTPYVYALGQRVLYVLCLALAPTCIHRGENSTSSSSRKLPGMFPTCSHSWLFGSQIFRRALNTWSGAVVPLQGLCHCHGGLGPGFGCRERIVS